MVDVRRRQLLLATSALLAQSVAHAQQQGGRVYRVAILHSAPVLSDAFLGRMRELGYEEGKNLLVDIRANSGEPLDRLPAAAMEVAARRPDVIVSGGGEFVLNAIEGAAPATPIVMAFVDFDPVATRHVASLARPGGNVTGVYLQQTDLAAKRLELLKEAVPSASRIAVLFDFQTRQQERLAEVAASKLGVTLLPQELRGSPYDYDAALRAATREKANAVLILSSGEFFPDRFKIMEAIRQRRLPSMATMPFVDAGPLLCYGANFKTMFALAAKCADRILKGQKPADIPIEQPRNFELVVNLKTAKELGITIPKSMEQRATEVAR